MQGRLEQRIADRDSREAFPIHVQEAVRRWQWGDDDARDIALEKHGTQSLRIHLQVAQPKLLQLVPMLRCLRRRGAEQIVGQIILPAAIV
jgi:hypothetical protein